MVLLVFAVALLVLVVKNERIAFSIVFKEKRRSKMEKRPARRRS